MVSAIQQALELPPYDRFYDPDSFETSLVHHHTPVENASYDDLVPESSTAAAPSYYDSFARPYNLFGSQHSVFGSQNPPYRYPQSTHTLQNSTTSRLNPAIVIQNVPYGTQNAINSTSNTPRQHSTGIDPVAVLPAYIAQCPTTIVIRGHYLTHSYDVETNSGIGMFKVKAKFISHTSLFFAHRKLVLDSNGHHLFTLRRKRLRLGSTDFYAGTDKKGKGRRLFEVKGKYAFGRPKAEAVLHNVVTGQQERLYTHGGSHSRNYTIRHSNGLVVANIDRRRFQIRREYTVTILPGMDISLILAMCLCQDDRVSHAHPGLIAGSGG